MTSIEARIWSTKMADNQHFRYINKLPCFKEIYGNWKRCLKAYSYTRKDHWTWSTNMAAMASKFNFECVIQYYTDQWVYYYDDSMCSRLGAVYMSPVCRASPLKRGTRFHYNFLLEITLLYMQTGLARLGGISLDSNGAPGQPGLNLSM